MAFIHILNSLQSSFLGGSQSKMQNQSGKDEVELVLLRALSLLDQAKVMPQL